MSNKSQSKSGLKTSKDFSWSEREMIIKDYLSSGQTKQAIWEKYSGQLEEHGQLIKWMRQLGYVESLPKRRLKSRRSMSKDQSRIRELSELRDHIEDLEKQLKESKLQAIAYSKMVDIAEQEFKIKIRKKLNTKPSKR